MYFDSAHACGFHIASQPSNPQNQTTVCGCYCHFMTAFVMMPLAPVAVTKSTLHGARAFFADASVAHLFRLIESCSAIWGFYCFWVKGFWCSCGLFHVSRPATVILFFSFFESSERCFASNQSIHSYHTYPNFY